MDRGYARDMAFRVEVDRAIIKNLAPGNYFPLLSASGQVLVWGTLAKTPTGCICEALPNLR